jgi:hypothetical protein
MLRMRALEQCHRIRALAVRVQRDSIDIGVARIVRRERARLPQLVERRRIIVLAHQCQSETIPHIGIVGRDGHCFFQQLRPLLVAAADPVEVGKIDHRRHKSRVEPQRRPIFRLGFGYLEFPTIATSL